MDTTMATKLMESFTKDERGKMLYEKMNHCMGRLKRKYYCADEQTRKKIRIGAAVGIAAFILATLGASRHRRRRH